jgi:protein gp37
MAEQTKIEWADSGFNPWLGCQHVSDGCENCYAETEMDKRYHRVVWGPHGERKRTTAGYWRGPLRWNATAASFVAQKGHRQRVFCASHADWLDNQAPQQWREDLGELVETTSQLDWLLLTKRIENYRSWRRASGCKLAARRQMFGSASPPSRRSTTTIAGPSWPVFRQWCVSYPLNRPLVR